MTVELHGTFRKSIKIRGLELASPVRADHVTIQTVKQHNDDVLRALAFHLIRPPLPRSRRHAISTRCQGSLRHRQQ